MQDSQVLNISFHDLTDPAWDAGRERYPGRMYLADGGTGWADAGGRRRQDGGEDARPEETNSGQEHSLRLEQMGHYPAHQVEVQQQTQYVSESNFDNWKLAISQMGERMIK